MSIIEITFFLSFLAILFIVNKKYFSTRVISLQSYINLDRKASSFDLFTIVFGTFFTANSLFNTANNAYIYGFSYFFFACGDVIGLLLLCFFIKKIFALRKNESIGQVIGQIHGPNSRIITGISGLFFAFSVILTQTKWIYKTIDSLLDIDFNISFIVYVIFMACYFLCMHSKESKWSVAKILGMFVILPVAIYAFCQINQKIFCFILIFVLLFYNSISGNASLVIKSILQFSFIIILLPILFSEIDVNIKSVNYILDHMPEAMRTVNLKFLLQDGIQGHMVMFLSGVMPILSPFFMSRVQLVSSANQAQKVFISMSVLMLVFFHLVTICALVAFYINPNLENGGNCINTFLYLLQHAIKTPLIKGVVLCGVMSVMFSAIDAGIHLANVSFICDILKPLRIVQKFPQNFSSQEYLIKIFTLILAILTLFAGLLIDDTNQILIFAINIWVALVTIPLIAVILDISAKPSSFYACGITGMAINLLYWYGEIVWLNIIGPVLPIMVVNSVVFLTLHLE